MALVITDDADRAELSEAIAHLKAKYDRLPKHWEARRLEVMRDIERLVDQWITLGLDPDGGKVDA